MASSINLRLPLGKGLGITLALGMAFTAVAVTSWQGPAAVHRLYWLAALLGVVLLIFIACRKALHWLGRQELCSPLIAFPLAYTTWFALGSVNLLGDNDTKVLSYAGAGLACYVVGALLVRQLWPVTRIPSPEFRNEWNRTYFWRVVAGLSLLLLLSYSVVVWQIGVPALDSAMAEARLQVAKFGPINAVLFTASWTLLVFGAAYLWTAKERPVLRKLLFIVIGIVALLLLSLGSRGYLFVPLLTALIARHYLYKRFKIATLALIGIFVFVALSVYGYIRDSRTFDDRPTVEAEGIQATVFPVLYAYLYIRQPVETLHDITEIIPRNIPYQHGLLTFGALETVLPGHHEMSDMFFKNILGNDFLGGGQPGTLLATFYGDFGLPGVLVGMFLVGMMMSAAYNFMWRRPTVFRLVIYAWLLQTSLFALFGAIFPYINTLWTPLFWWLLHSCVLKKSELATESLNSDK